LLSAASKGVVFIAGFSLQKHYIATAFSTATIDGCPLFPIDNVWNRDISTLSVDRNSANYIASMGSSLHNRYQFVEVVAVNLENHPEKAFQVYKRRQEA
jgi:hypothetical protein